MHKKSSLACFSENVKYLYRREKGKTSVVQTVETTLLVWYQRRNKKAKPSAAKLYRSTVYRGFVCRVSCIVEDYRRNKSDAGAMQRICTCFVCVDGGERCRIEDASVVSEEFGECRGQVDEVDRLGDVVAEARLDALILNVRHDIRRQRDDWHGLEPIRLFPFSNFPAGLVAVLSRHVEITLGGKVSMPYRGFDIGQNLCVHLPESASRNPPRERKLSRYIPVHPWPFLPASPPSPNTC